MSAPQQVLAAAGFNFVPQTLTVGGSGGTWGFSDSSSGLGGAFGSLVPVEPFPDGVATEPTATDLTVVYATVVLQSFFTSLQIEDGSGSIRTYTSASATFTTSGGRSFWRWGTGSSKVYTSANNGAVRSVVFS